MAPRDLPRRLGVAAVGIPAVLAFLYAGGWVLAVPLAVLAAIGADELYRIAVAGGASPFRRVGAVGAALLPVAATARPDWSCAAPWILAVLGGLALVSLTLALWTRWPDGRPLAAAAATLLGAAYAGLPLAFVSLLHALPARAAWAGPAGSAWAGLVVVALPLAATWVGDSAAYFAGSAWGRAKLFPAVSPNKSWMGAWAGLAGSAAAGAAWWATARPVLADLPVTLPLAVAIGAFLGAAGQVGDLVESLLKREAGVKDSGRIFPGHGGLLDRLDALTFALPLAYGLLAVAEAIA